MCCFNMCHTGIQRDVTPIEQETLNSVLEIYDDVDVIPIGIYSFPFFGVSADHPDLGELVYYADEESQLENYAYQLSDILMAEDNAPVYYSDSDTEVYDDYDGVDYLNNAITFSDDSGSTVELEISEDCSINNCAIDSAIPDSVCDNKLESSQLDYSQLCDSQSESEEESNVENSQPY